MDKGTVRLELFRRNRLHSPDLPGYNRNIEKEVLWSSVFVTLVAKKYRFMQFELDRVFDTR